MAASVNSQLENWPEAVLASCQWEGQTYGLPATAGTYAVIYNQEMLDAKGIPSDRASFPKTWTDLRALSKEFTQWDGDTLVTMGILPKPADAVEFAIVSASNGGQLYDTANQTYTIDSDQNVEIMQFFLDWLDEEYQGDYQKVMTSNNWTENVVDGKPPMFQAGQPTLCPDRLLDHRRVLWPGRGGLHQLERGGLPDGPQRHDPGLRLLAELAGDPEGLGARRRSLLLPRLHGRRRHQDLVRQHPRPADQRKVPLLVPQVAVEKRGEEFATEITEFFRGLLDISTPMWTSPVTDFANDQLTAGDRQDHVQGSLAEGRPGRSAASQPGRAGAGTEQRIVTET